MENNLPNSRSTPGTQRAQAYDIIGSRTLVAAHVSKLRRGNMIHHQPGSTPALMNSNSQSDIMRISQEQQSRIVDNENALQLMPEIEWASRVLVSSILSPKDMTKRELLYNISIDWLPPSTKSTIIDEIKSEIETVYNYSDSLYSIFKDALFTKGSHPRLILPEAAVDKIINSGETLTMESLGSLFSASDNTLKNKGYFGPLNLDQPAGSVKPTISMESFRRASGFTANEQADEKFMFKGFANEKENTETILTIEHLSLTDNVDAIKMPSYLEAIAAGARDSIAGRPTVDFGEFDFGTKSTNESNNGSDQVSKNSKLNPAEFSSAVYKSAPNNIVTHLRIPGRTALTRRSVGRPLVLSIPSESVLPIHVPGDVRRKLGYVIIIDENGHPITLAGSEQIIARASTQVNSANSANSSGNSNMGSMILSKAARNMTSGNQVTNFKDLTKIFEQLVEDNVIPRLMNGAYPGGAEIADTGDLYTLMMARTLCSMRTRLVFVPAEMLTYFAFDYHSNGMGKSLLDANKMVIAIRAGLMLTRMTGELRNSIPLTKVTMKIDPDDPDFEKTYEEALHIVSQTRQPQYPLSTLAVNDLMDWVHRAGFVFAFEGHPRMPDTGFEFEKISHDNVLPSQELYDSLGKQLYMGFGIPPELMDSAYDPEFAIAIATRNIMFTQTILEAQKIAAGHITDDHHRLILSDGVMMNKIVALIKSKWGEIENSLPEEEKAAFESDPKKFAMSLVEKIVNSIDVRLPSPDATTLSNQKSQYDEFEAFISQALPNFIGSDIVSADVAPELSEKLNSMSATIKSAIIRNWMAENNILPELFKMSSVDEEGKPRFDLLQLSRDFAKGLAINIMSYAKTMVPVDGAISTDSDNLGLTTGEAGNSSSGSDSSSGGGDDFSAGGDDIGGDLDFSDDEQPKQPGASDPEEPKGDGDRPPEETEDTPKAE